MALARRETKLYGGLNIRLAPVKQQEIRFFNGPLGATPRRAWGEVSGIFSGLAETGLAVFQSPSNPHYPGDWIQYPEINWLQPTFPAAGTRYVLKPGQPLTLKFRLWIHAGKASESKLADVWTAWVNSSESTSPQTVNSNR